MKKSILVVSILIFLVLSYIWIQQSLANNERLRLVSLGDSITYGTGDPTKSGYVEKVRTKLSQEKKLPVELTNYGIPRYTTTDILNQMQNKTVLNQIKKADYVTLYIGTNDFRKSADYEFENLDVTRIQEGKIKFRDNFESILRTIRNQNADAPIFILGLYHPYVDYENEQQIFKVIEEWNQVIMEKADEFTETIYIPTIDLFCDQPKEDFFSDDLHLNPNGYQLIADRLIQAIRSYIK